MLGERGEARGDTRGRRSGRGTGWEPSAVSGARGGGGPADRAGGGVGIRSIIRLF